MYREVFFKCYFNFLKYTLLENVHNIATGISEQVLFLFFVCVDLFAVVLHKVTGR